MVKSPNSSRYVALEKEHEVLPFVPLVAKALRVLPGRDFRGLAHYMGISRDMLYRICAGASIIDLSMLAYISQYTQIPLIDLLKTFENPAMSELVDAGFMVAFAALTPDHQAAVANFIRDLRVEELTLARADPASAQVVGDLLPLWRKLQFGPILKQMEVLEGFQPRQSLTSYKERLAAHKEKRVKAVLDN